MRTHEACTLDNIPQSTEPGNEGHVTVRMCFVLWEAWWGLSEVGPGERLSAPGNNQKRLSRLPWATHEEMNHVPAHAQWSFVHAFSL